MLFQRLTTPVSVLSNVCSSAYELNVGKHVLDVGGIKNLKFDGVVAVRNSSRQLV